MADEEVAILGMVIHNHLNVFVVHMDIVRSKSQIKNYEELTIDPHLAIMGLLHIVFQQQILLNILKSLLAIYMDVYNMRCNDKPSI